MLGSKNQASVWGRLSCLRVSGFLGELQPLPLSHCPPTTLDSGYWSLLAATPAQCQPRATNTLGCPDLG
jgi:hypothetical protein